MAIGGNLPWNPQGASLGGAIGAGTPQALGAAYGAAYNSALGMNQSNYDNILKGYQDTLAGQTSAQDAISRGYTGLYNNVTDKIRDIGSAQMGAINDSYAAQVGQQSQGLINRGLGNTTVQNSVLRGLQLDRGKAQNDLSNRVAGTQAQYMSQLGLAGLDYQNQANVQNTGLAGQQLQWMNSVNAGYPNAALYSQLAQQYGANAEAQRNRDAMRVGGRSAAGGPRSGGVAGTYGPDAAAAARMGELFAPGQSAGGGIGGGGGDGGYGNVAGGIGSYLNPAGGGGSDPYYGYGAPTGGGVGSYGYDQGIYDPNAYDPYAGQQGYFGQAANYAAAYGGGGGGDWGGGGDF